MDMEKVNDNVCMIPADGEGNKLYIKNFRVEDGKPLVSFRSTYNDMPFMDTIVYSVDADTLAICGDDGTVLFRFNKEWISNIV